MADELNKKIVIPIEADAKKADAQVDKLKKNSEQNPINIPVNIDIGDITKALHAIQGAVLKMEQSFDKDVKFSGLQKGLDDVLSKINSVTKTFNKGKDTEFQAIRVDLTGFKKLTDATDAIQRNIESLNNSKIDLNTFERLEETFKNIETLINSIIKGMNFDAIRPSTQVQDEIDTTTKKLEKLSKTEEKISKLEKKFSSRTYKQAGASILADNFDDDEKQVRDLIKYIEEYIKLGGDLSKFKFNFLDEDGIKKSKSFLDVLEKLKKNKLIDLIDTSEITNDVNTIQKLKNTIEELNKELTDAKIRENRDLNVSLDTKSVEDFAAAISQAVEKIGELHFDIPKDFTLEGLSTENLDRLINKIDEVVQNIQTLGNILTGIDASKLTKVDSKDEIQFLDNVENKVKDITSAVDKKTQAFKKEELQVRESANKEIKALSNIESKVKNITQTLDRNISLNIDASSIINTLDIVNEKFDEISNKKINPIVDYSSVESISDESGKTLKWYRGVKDVKSGFISDKDDGTFFTTNKELAAKYAGELGKVYEAELKMKNILEVDVNGGSSELFEYLGAQSDEASIKITELSKSLKSKTGELNNAEYELVELETKLKSFENMPGMSIMASTIKQQIETTKNSIKTLVDEIDVLQTEYDKISDDRSNPYGMVGTHDISSWAKNNGLDGVIFNNIKTTVDDITKLGTSAVIFNSEQLNNLKVARDTVEDLHDEDKPINIPISPDTSHFRDDIQEAILSEKPIDVDISPNIDNSVFKDYLQQEAKDLSGDNQSSVLLGNETFKNDVEQVQLSLQRYKDTIAEIDKMKLEPETDESKKKIEELTQLAMYFKKQALDAIEITKFVDWGYEGGGKAHTFASFGANFISGNPSENSMRYAGDLENWKLMRQFTREWSDGARDWYGEVKTTFSGINEEINTIINQALRLPAVFSESEEASKKYIKQISVGFANLSSYLGEGKTDRVNNILAKYPELEQMKHLWEKMDEDTADEFSSIKFAKDGMISSNDEWLRFIQTLPKAQEYLKAIGYEFKEIEQSQKVNQTPLSLYEDSDGQLSFIEQTKKTVDLIEEESGQMSMFKNVAEKTTDSAIEGQMTLNDYIDKNIEGQMSLNDLVAKQDVDTSIKDTFDADVSTTSIEQHISDIKTETDAINENTDALKENQNAQKSDNSNEQKAEIDSVAKAYEETTEILNKYYELKQKEYNGKLSETDKSSLETYKTELDDVIAHIGKYTATTEEAIKAQKKFDETFDKYKNSFSSNIQDDLNIKYNKLDNNKNNKTSAYKNELIEIKKAIDALKIPIDFTNPDEIEQLQKAEKNIKYMMENLNGRQFELISEDKINNSLNSAYKSLHKDTAAPEELRNRLRKVIAEFERLKSSGKEVNGIKFDELQNELKEVQLAIQKTGKTGASIGDKIKKKFKDVAAYFATYVSIQDALQVIRQGFETIKEYDKALTEIRKVLDETTSSLKEFQSTSFDVAKQVGTTALEIQNSAADFMRLGYSLKEASKLSEDANIYANVGDMDITEATEHMISSIQAWQSEFSSATEASTNIIDRYNEIGNRFAITSADIGSAMERSAAALKAGGNTLNESIGIITAGNLIQQDADTTANALKVLSLRIRGSKADLESMGESVDDLVDSTSKMREQIQALTGVDIMIDENTFKSTAEIIQEIGAGWSKLTDVSKAATLELLAGKTRASTVAGLIENYQTIEEVIKAAEESENSARIENEKYIQSIEGRLNLLQSQAQEFWYKVIDSDTIKNGITLLTDLLELGTNIVDTFGVLPTIMTGIGAGLAVENVGINTLVAC